MLDKYRELDWKSHLTFSGWTDYSVTASLSIFFCSSFIYIYIYINKYNFVALLSKNPPRKKWKKKGKKAEFFVVVYIHNSVLTKMWSIASDVFKRAVASEARRNHPVVSFLFHVADWCTLHCPGQHFPLTYRFVCVIAPRNHHAYNCSQSNYRPRISKKCPQMEQATH